MADYQSYSTYVAPEESQDAPYRNPVARDTGEVTSVVVRNGEIASETTHNNHFVKASELTPFTDAGDWRAGAKKASGSPAQTITADTIVQLGGTEAQVKHFVAAGLLKETANGYELADAVEPQQVQEDLLDSPGMPQEFADAIDAAMSPFDDKTLEAGLSLGIAHMAGQVDFNSVVRKLSMGSGIEPADAQQRAQFILGTYQQQADVYLGKQGISKEDLPGFYEFAKTQQSALMGALNKHIREGSLADYKPLVSKFMNSTAPSADALRANGFAVKTVDKVDQVRIQGVWMSRQAAAKAGLI
jgi:hypothetical protein